MKLKFFFEYSAYLGSFNTVLILIMPTVSTPFTYCHLLNLLSAFTFTEVSFPFVLPNFSFVLLLTNWKEVVRMMLSATLRMISSVVGFVCANAEKENNNSGKRICLIFQFYKEAGFIIMLVTTL